jgi:hypothetical protein
MSQKEDQKHKLNVLFLKGDLKLIRLVYKFFTFFTQARANTITLLDGVAALLAYERITC